MPKLHVIIASTRPTRVGLPVANWFLGRVKAHAAFDPALVDLLEVNLPHMDEPKHPRLGEYEHDHTKKWSALINGADAFAMVCPEYNYGAPPALLNALNYLSKEWAYKPVAFVSYGGVSGGTRGVQMVKQVVTALNMMPLPLGVTIPFVGKQIKDGVFETIEPLDKTAKDVLDDLLRWTNALKAMRS
jgi:NAD(P)H-dependent FMN reductase